MTWIGLLAWMAHAQDVPVPEGEIRRPRRTIDTEEYRSLQQLSEAFERQVGSRDTELEKLRRQLEAKAREEGLIPGPAAAAATATTATTAPTPKPAPVTPPAPASPPKVTAPPKPPGRSVRVGDRIEAGSGQASDQGSLGGVLLFDVPEPAPARETAVPAGSYVQGTVLTGVEANARDEIPMLVQLDHAVVGPNQHHIDLRGCMVLVKVRGNLSTDRVEGQAARLSCVRNDGEIVDAEIRGYLAGEDNTFGVTGQLITRQGRVLAAGAVASLAEAAGTAVATAQQTTQVLTNPLGQAGQATNVTGNQAAFVAGSSGAEAASQIADWYLGYADQLVPAIAVGSGREVWIVLLQTVEVPPLSEER